MKTKAKISKWGPNQTQALSDKGKHKQNKKDSLQNGKEYFDNATKQRLISKIYKQLLQHTHTHTIQSIKRQI